MGTSRSKERNKKYEARREKVHLPDGTDIKRYAATESERTGKPKWKVLQDLYIFYQKHHPKTPEEQKVELYFEFVDKVTESDPKLKDKFKFLSKYIFNYLLEIKLVDTGNKIEWKKGREQLDDVYYEELKKL